MQVFDEVNKIIEDYFRPYGEIHVTCALEFWYDNERKEMAWSFLSNEISDNLFDKFIEDELGCPTVNNFIYSLCHEFGHFMTQTQFDKSAWDRYYKIRDDLDSISNREEREMAYFHLDQELAASRWAAEHIREHYEEITEWSENVLGPAIGRAFSNSEDLQELVDCLMEEEDV